MPALSAIQSRLTEHEEWLISLRQDPCMTLAKIRNELENQKGVNATSHQLETYFRNLGQRKNLSRRDWIAVFRALDSQKAFGRRFRLFLSGKEVEERELQKKRKNAKPAQPLVESLVDADRLLTNLPDGVTVKRRPPSGSSRSQRHSITPQSMSHAHSDVNPDSEARTLLDNILGGSEPLPGPSNIRHDTSLDSSFPGSRLTSTSSASQSHLQIAPVDMESHPIFETSYTFGDFEMDNGITFSFPDSGIWDTWTRQLSPGAFLRSLASPDAAIHNDRWMAGLNYASPTNITFDHHIRDLTPIESARLLVGDAGSIILRHARDASNEQLPTAEEVLDNLRSLVVINAADRDFCDQFDIFSGSKVFTDQFIQLFLFSIVNNFAGLNDIPAKVMIEFINRHELVRSRILCHLRNGTSTIYSRALVEKLLEAAIEACDAKTVHELLVLEIVRPNDIVFFGSSPRGNRHRLTPVEKASTLRHFEIVALLVRFDADVNKTYQAADSNMERGALESAIGLWGKYRPIEIKLVELLLSNGAAVSGRLMGAAIRWGDVALVEKLMSSLSPSAHVDCVDDLIVDAAEYLRNDIGLKFVRQVMQACRDMHKNKCIEHKNNCIDSEHDFLVEAMRNAARRNNRGLVDLLLPHGGQEGLDSALTAAARFGSHSLVHELIAHGAHANGQACTLDGDSFDTTPLAEAIRRGDDELVALFAKEGAWGQIGEPKHLEAALRAIAESGSLVYLLQVLQLVPCPDPKALSFALVPAINACHEELALRLLEAGADLRYHAARLGSPLAAALRIKSQAITWTMLESDITSNDIMNDYVAEAAVAWGDLDIVKALFVMRVGVDDNFRRPLFSLAIKAGNRSLIDVMINLGGPLNISPAQRSRSPGWTSRLHPGNYWSPLSAATLVRDVGLSNYLLDHGADPADEQTMLNAIGHDRMLLNNILQRFRQRHPQGRTGFGGEILIHTLRTHDGAALDSCLRAGFDVNDMVWNEYKKVTPLGFAIEQHHTCMQWIPKLLDAGSDVNLLASMTDGHETMQVGRKAIPSRQTALLDAIKTRSLPLVELLISRGAHVQKEAKLGLKRTPLQKACEVGSHTIVDLLLRHNADVNEAPAARGGATALQLAAKAGSLRIAKRLLDLGAKVDAPGVRIGGRCAIEFAAEYGRLDMILFLCNAAGGKFDSGQYKSAIALAQENGHSACADLLTELSVQNQAAIDASIR